MYKLLVFFIILPTMLKAQDIATKADEYLTAMNKQKQFSGTVLIAKGGSIVFQKAYGYADFENKKLNTTETEYRIGSVTKQFTSAIILRLAEQGKLSLTDAVYKYIPDYPEGKEITIHHLLSHTSGIQNFTSLAEFHKWETHRLGLAEVVSKFKHLPLNFLPGVKFEYSNSNYILLSYVAELASKQKLSSLLQIFILKKAGMQNSGLDIDGRKSANQASGYVSFIEEKPVPASVMSMSIPSGAGAMYSTVGDIYKWDRALKTNLILTTPLAQKAFTPNKGNYGYGWLIGNAFGHKEYTHGGAINGFLSNISRFPDDDACIIVLSNNMQSPVEQISKTLSAIAFEQNYSLPQEKKTVKVVQEVLDLYIGEYEMNPQFIIKITTDKGRLFAQATGQPVFELFPSSDKDFFLKVVPADVTFNKDAGGKIAEMELHQNGTFKLKKIK